MAFTYFFRDAQTLALMIDEALSSLRGQASIRIWDAGCAHGPEPYTLAMMLRERMSDFVFRNVRIHATDVESQFGPRIADGIYLDREVQRIPEATRKRFFRPGAAGRHFHSRAFCCGPGCALGLPWPSKRARMLLPRPALASVVEG